MDYIKLNNTNLLVSPLCLGTVNYGTSLDNETSKEQISKFVELGGNFLDTAHVYGDWVPGEKARSEKVIGQWMKENSARDKVIIATKGAHPDLSAMGTARVTAKDINKDLNESLRCLDTDHIDLYFLHRDDINVPVAELIDYLEEAKKQGKIRYYGCSNWTLPRIKEAQEYAKKKGFDGFVCNQTLLSLADINIDNVTDKTMVILDQEGYEYHKKSDMNLMAYTAIANGYFTRRLQGMVLSDRARSYYDNPVNDAIYNKMVKISKGTNLTIFDLSLKYVMMQEFPSVPLVSFSSKKQLEEAMVSCSKIVNESIMDELAVLKRFTYVEEVLV